MAPVEAPVDGKRQLERASRLLDVISSSVLGTPTPLHKSLEQLFGEVRSRPQPHVALGVSSGGTTASASRLLQGPQAQKLERDLADFSLAPVPGAGLATSLADTAPEEQPHLGLREFFELRQERILVGAIENAYLDCMRSFETSSFDNILSDWNTSKEQIINTMAPQGFAPATMRGVQVNTADGRAAIKAAPAQDGLIINALLHEKVGRLNIEQISSFSCESCPPYRAELEECWRIVWNMLKPSRFSIMCGAIHHLQTRWSEDMKAFVYQATDLHLGGVPDAWSLIRGLGCTKFETSNFPRTSAHLWYAAYAAARAGYTQLLLELPGRAAKCSVDCRLLRPVCQLMARHLSATTDVGHTQDVAVFGDLDTRDLRSDFYENIFHEILVSLLLNSTFIFSRLPEATVEDWLWFRLHKLLLAGESAQSNELENLRADVLTLPPSHYDPAAGAAAIPSATGIAATMPSTYGLRGVYDPFTGVLGSLIQDINMLALCPHCMIAYIWVKSPLLSTFCFSS